MYNKLFQRILYSSIWTQDYATRIVWVTFLAAMDEDSVVHFATTKNVAAVAQVTEEEAERAVALLEAPDPHSANPEHEGRRVQRIPGGWVVLNAKVYRDIATREQARQGIRQRVAKHRAAVTTAAIGNGDVTVGNADPSIRNGSVTGSDTDTEVKRSRSSRRDDPAVDDGFAVFWAAYPKKVARQAALRSWRRLRPDVDLQMWILRGLEKAKRSDQWTRDGGAFVCHASTFLNGCRWEDDWTPAPASAAEAAVEAERRHAATLLAEMRAKRQAAAEGRA